MAVSEAQKKATKKYLEGLDEIRVRAKEGTKARWKATAEGQGKSLNQFIVDTVEAAVDGHKPTVQTQTATGEALEQFVERAVETQAKRDMTSLRLGINPATGERLVKAPERPQGSD